MKKSFVKLLWQEVIISEVESLVQYSRSQKENAYFFDDYVQVLQNVPVHC